MLEAIRRFFRDRLDATAEATEDDTDPLALATAALLFEVMRADQVFDATEHAHVMRLLEQQFDLAHEDLETVARLAEQEVESATDLYQFTRLINDHYDQHGRVALVRNLWQVAWADGRIDRFEEHLIRRVADLLHVRHADFIRTRQEAGKLMRSGG